MTTLFKVKVRWDGKEATSVRNEETGLKEVVEPGEEFECSVKQAEQLVRYDGRFKSADEAKPTKETKKSAPKKSTAEVKTEKISKS